MSPVGRLAYTYSALPIRLFTSLTAHPPPQAQLSPELRCIAHIRNLSSCPLVSPRHLPITPSLTFEVRMELFFSALSCLWRERFPVNLMSCAG